VKQTGNANDRKKQEFTDPPEIEKEVGEKRIPLPYSSNEWTELAYIWLEYVSDE